MVLCEAEGARIATGVAGMIPARDPAPASHELSAALLEVSVVAIGFVPKAT